MDRHSMAIDALLLKKSTREKMITLSNRREIYTRMAIDALLWINEDEEAVGKLEYAKYSISECDKTFKAEMTKYLDAMSYLQKYNDEFNDSKQWREWLEFRNEQPSVKFYL